MEFGLAGTVAPDRVQMNARSDHRLSQNDGVAFIGCHRGHDIGAVGRLGGA